ncbi:phosphatidylglycerol lysyltransferase domain-containing protein [Lysinibacter cavernae]|uniref:Lysylphosphatidylglycerol synthetase-like protein (DUF2156 family)/membrane protein DedA with SNARE-associated domain n=1 Tax=Lysinibacter cavernae TaxID=1640652 RepID=A0A7X5TT55_9MICO|nr:phosphatidylglycerol lysyltransferase domain-containing protein [Lysinibacter cavernae]NIH53800.1 lysylphosphatidylglycerol synthetase-like protein (DUF2156 family)/membrane protein DedA with SNARE-associated domain [Lysinibacter cavernae]
MLSTLPAAVVLLVLFVIAGFEGVGLPLPGETILMHALLTVQDVPPLVLLTVAVAGAVGGEFVGYWIGRRWGTRLLRSLEVRFPERIVTIELARTFTASFGIPVVVVSHFVAVLSAACSPLAGALGMRLKHFVFASIGGSVLWSAVLFVVTQTGDQHVAETFRQIAWAALLVFLVFLVLWAGRAAHSIAVLIRRTPFTLSFVVVFLTIGTLTDALWRPAARIATLEPFFYGLPAFEEGRWWTIATGTFLAMTPWEYVLLVVGAAIAGSLFEARYGWAKTAALFGAGQVVAVLVSAFALWVLAPTGWDWAVRLSTQLDVGPSGGVFALITGLFLVARPPWRLRLILLVWAVVGLQLMYVGSLADLEHFVAVAAVSVLYAVTQRGRQRTHIGIREQRLIAFTGLVALGAIQLLSALFVLDGPLGRSEPGVEGWVGVVLDLLVIVVIARGIRRGRRWAWWVTIVLGILNLLELVVLVIGVAVLGDLGDEYTISFAGSLLWVFLFVFLLWSRRSFQVRSRRRSRQHTGGAELDAASITDLITAQGGGTLSWMATWKSNQYLATNDGQGFIAYQEHSGVALALGDPIVPDGGMGTAVAEYIRFTDRAGLTPALFSVGKATVDAAPTDWSCIQVAEDTIIDLPELEMKGKSWQPIRSSLNRAEREGISFRMSNLNEESWAVLAQVRAISEGWVGDKALPEMGFTLGGVDEALDPNVRVGIAIDEDGSLHGVTSWLPVYGRGGVVRGWTLDLMRRREGGFKPVMEFLLISSALTFKDEGAEFASLSGSPLAHSGTGNVGKFEGLLDAMSGMLEPFYGFQSLHTFKAKFAPRYEPMYLLYRDEADLPRISIGLIRAFVPSASTAELVRLGLSSGRSDRG